MSRESAARPAREQTPSRPVRRGPISLSFALISALIGAALTAGLLSVLLEWAGIALGWWPGSHSRDLLLTERGYIEAIDDYPLSPLRPTQITTMAWGRVDEGLALVGIGASAGVYVVAAINTVKLLVLRSVIVLLALPGYALAIVAGLFEGLVARDIRKFTGGHESAYVFHKAKRWVLPSVMLTVTLYLMLPWSIPPALLFAPTMCLAGAMTYIAASRFKKFV
ncbi:MAG TPA: DUF4400 domain-containing protein [Halieaceae bacterium]|uniref:DUF4400 domain-containing protein n=1 Tax=Haliea salexigens TaxID=287487 RepID=UPI0004144EC6|nr:DUF4400 domain-containing protein [Haliea salexigens]HBM83229.1 DUF4400 domain-containing protein [Halieaceae bacterium]|tara:strand:+ start:3555 stop:4223 length:669 start_codon:yes stop_codon:yes gene_type:complete